MNYYGFKVVDDPMYHRLLKNNVDYTIQDIDKMSTIIKEYIPEKKVALDIGCHYGFFTKFLSEQFETVHAFDFPNDIYECFEINMTKFKCDNVVRHPYGIGEKDKPVATNDWFKEYNRRGPLGNHIDEHANATKKYEIKALDNHNLNKKE